MGLLSGMAPQSLLERAFELADAGHCLNLQDLERQLKNEGYTQVYEHLSGASLRLQLRARMQASDTRK
jgi:hypothetical protein